MEVRIIIVCLSCVLLSSALKLPGPCPTVPPTQFTIPHKDTWRRNPEILTVVPFSAETPSYFFYDLKGVYDPLLFLETRSNDSDFLENFRLVKIGSRSFLEAVVDKEVTDKDSITLRSTIYNFNNPVSVATCHPELQEEIRMWVEKKFIIIWSCVGDEEEHDEAVMFGTFVNMGVYVHDLPEEDYKQMMQVLKVVAGKYMSQGVIESIDWDQGSARRSRGPGDMYPCPDGVTNNLD